MLIVGLIAGMAVIRIGGPQDDREMAMESGLLQQLLAVAAEEAVLRAGQTGVAVSQHGLRFMFNSDGERWQVMYDDGPFRERTLPHGYRYLLLSGTREKRLFVDGFPDTPQIVFQPTGDTTAFQLSLLDDGDETVWQLKGDTYGRIERLQREAEFQ